ncbi:hypothetical protein GCM10009601_58450 [Streptomyces thermospinosisporus]|uniref:Uncharacterized protein n=1 Tax=Streptomyces thermospinosisporus TaxID=161482 RepID=A0ABP4JXD1_9ACTN
MVHFRVTDVSGTPAREITWSVSAWRTPDEPGEKESSDGAVNRDLPLTLSEEASEAKDCAIGFASVLSSSPLVKYVKGSMADGDILYFPDCLASHLTPSGAFTRGSLASHAARGQRDPRPPTRIPEVCFLHRPPPTHSPLDRKADRQRMAYRVQGGGQGDHGRDCRGGVKPDRRIRGRLSLSLTGR